MGSLISSIMAELYLQYIEETYVKQWLDNKEITYYKRYVDAILIIYDQNKTNEHTILHQINKIHKNLQFKMSTEENNTINYLDISIHRNNNMNISSYRKPTCTDTTIQFSSNHPYEHKIASFKYYIHGMITLPITEKSKQEEWKTILTIAKSNGYPVNTINNLKTKLIAKKRKHQQYPMTIPHNKTWVTSTCLSPIIRRITNLFTHYNLNIAFRATNTIQQQLSEKPTNKNSSGIYKLKCNICNNVYVGQSGRSINVRHKEHIRYIRTNNPLSAYALHILQNRYEYGTTADTLQLLKTCQKDTRMNVWEALYMQVFNQHKVMITEQQVSDTNPLYEL